MFSNMNSAERMLLESCPNGEMLNLAKERPTEKTKKNEIRAEFLKVLILNNNQEIEVDNCKYILRISSQGINFQGAYISGIFDFSSHETTLPFRFTKSIFENQIFLMKSKIEEIDFNGSLCSCITTMGLICRRNIFLNNGFESYGEINFITAEIQDSLVCNDSKFINQNGFSLNFNNAKIDGNIFLSGNFESIGEINFLNSQIGKSIYCSGKFINKNKISLNFNGSTINGNIFLKDNFISNGEVNFASTEIKKNLECDNGKFLNEDKNSTTLNCNGAEVKGSIFLRNGFLSKGEVNFINLKIAGILDCSNGKFINKMGISLNCSGIKVDNTVFLRNGFCSNGEVNFSNSQIGNNLECVESKFRSEKALICNSMKIGANLLFKDSIVFGDINLNSVQIENKLLFSSLTINGNIILSLAKINVINVEGKLLENTQLKEIFLDGLEYNHLSGKNSDFLTFKGELRKTKEFKPQPYKQLAKVLRKMGHNKDADEIMIEYNKIITKKTHNKFTKILKQIYGFTAGYGYKPMRVFGTMLIIWLICSLFYFNGANVAVFSPSNALVFQKKIEYQCIVDNNGTLFLDKFNWKKYNQYNNWTKSEKLEGEYTTFQPFLYSLDLIIPLVDLRMDKDWGVFISPINNEFTLNDLTRWVIRFEILFGWIYSLILVAILSGLAKNEKD